MFETLQFIKARQKNQNAQRSEHTNKLCDSHTMDVIQQDSSVGTQARGTQTGRILI